MVRHAARAVPWVLVWSTGLLIGVLMEAVHREPLVLWPLQGVAVGLLAGAVGWCLDEPAAAVVDPAPRGLAWRTAARLLGVAVLMGWWSVAVWMARESLFGHPWIVLLQGWAAAVVSLAWVTWRRRAGEATPGQRWAVSAVPVVMAWALVRPLEEQLPVFPYAFGGPYGDWGASALLWTVATAVGLLALGLALVGVGERPRLRRTDGVDSPPSTVRLP